MNRKIALSGLSILGSLALVGGLTFAAFTDSVTQTGNTFAVGTPSLQIKAGTDCANVNGYLDTIPGPSGVGYTGLVPGSTAPAFNFCLRNSGDSSLDLTADVSSITPANDGDQVIDNTLLIKWNCGVDTSSFSPRDWLNGGNASLGNLAPGANVACTMTGNIPASAGNEIQGQTALFDVIYNGAQPAPSPST